VASNVVDLSFLAGSVWRLAAHSSIVCVLIADTLTGFGQPLELC